MDIRSAQAFIAVAEELNFGRAANRLHMAQPPLSRMIRQLEEELGARLFERTTHWVTLTPHGEAVLEPMRELVMLSQRIPEIVRKSLRGDAGRVRLGFAEASVDVGVGNLATLVRQRRPGIVLELQSSQFAHLGLDRLRRGALDLLIARVDVVPSDLESEVVSEEELLLALPVDHPLASRDIVRSADLAEEPWVVLPGGSATGLNRLSLLSVEGGFIPRVVQSAPESSTLLLLVSAGVGVALTLSSVRTHLPARGIAFRSISPAQEPIRVRLIWRRNDANPALAAVVALAREALHGQQ
ncbi:LysR family transcriptional regulator [Microbacterium protaetiae]|uniref:LysR family transcriptional regulator n=1 Tax=Microbacterium protaetiae TaxID=2509458 RepID=A0A4P6EHG8_9MICO|nr:LysR substrate-binding domain-containing protein [Microbacterium protaetiae]QAY59557.1 LysR family transcriptional regulator [Microbacterium protaetiae]